MDPDGNLIVAGSAEDNSARTPVLMWITLSGEVDAAFSDALPVTQGESFTSVLDLGISAAGLLVLAEAYNDASDRRVRLIKYDLQGRLDLAFGQNGGTLLEDFAFLSPDVAWRDNDVLVTDVNRILSLTHDGVINDAFGDGGGLILSSNQQHQFGAMTVLYLCTPSLTSGPQRMRVQFRIHPIWITWPNALRWTAIIPRPPLFMAATLPRRTCCYASGRFF